MSLNISDKELLQSKAYINGKWVDSNDGETFPVTNPATGEVIAEVARCGADETHTAIAAAEDSMREWRKTSVKERAAVLRRWFDLMMEAQDDLATILTAEQGKPIAEAKGEVAYGASYIEWFAEEAKRVYGDVIAAPTTDKRVVVIKQPVGVVACITPWNFPERHADAQDRARPLAVGSSVVCKPANATPLSALAFAVLAERAGVPAGVINIVAGKTAEIGEALTSSDIVRKLTFTGSTAVGKQLIAACAGTVKRTSMELGGNAPFIVFDDANLDAAVQGAVMSKFRNAGQTCVCSNRILVQESVYDEFSERVMSAAGEFKNGQRARRRRKHGSVD